MSEPAFQPPETHFAPAGRDSEEEFRQKMRQLESASPLEESLDAMPTLVMVLNTNRQIVAANRSLLAALRAAIADILAKRPGEALGCVRADLGPDGCGTGPYCVRCGAVQAILESQNQDRQAVRECRILVDGPEGMKSLDLKVTVTPLAVGRGEILYRHGRGHRPGEAAAGPAADFFPRRAEHGRLHPGLRPLLAGRTRRGPRVLRGDRRPGGSTDRRHPGPPRPGPGRVGRLADHAPPHPHPRPPSRSSACSTCGTRRPSIAAIELDELWDGLVVADRQLLLRVLGNMLKTR